MYKFKYILNNTNIHQPSCVEYSGILCTVSKCLFKGYQIMNDYKKSIHLFLFIFCCVRFVLKLTILSKYKVSINDIITF